MATTPLLTPAADHHSISTTTTTQPRSLPTAIPQEAPAPASGIQMDTQTPMDMSDTLTDAPSESTTVCDPVLTPQSTPFQSMLNSDPLLSASSPLPLPQHMSDSYMPSSGYVSYMETLLESHFPQDDDTEPLY